MQKLMKRLQDTFDLAPLKVTETDKEVRFWLPDTEEVVLRIKKTHNGFAYEWHGVERDNLKEMVDFVIKVGVL